MDVPQSWCVGEVFVLWQAYCRYCSQCVQLVGVNGLILVEAGSHLLYRQGTNGDDDVKLSLG